MKYFLPNDLQPSEQTLQFIRRFARNYKPSSGYNVLMLRGINFGIA